MATAKLEMLRSPPPLSRGHWSKWSQFRRRGYATIIACCETDWPAQRKAFAAEALVEAGDNLARAWLDTMQHWPNHSDVIIRIAEGPAVAISKAVYEGLLMRKCTWPQL
jgi:hypothetical protein